MSERLVTFYRIDALTPRGAEPHVPVDWAKAASARCAHPATVDLLNGTRLLPAAVDGNPEQVILGRKVDGPDVQMAHLSQGTFRPIEGPKTDEFFAKVTYLQFFRGINALAMVSGAGERVSEANVEHFLDEAEPLRNGCHWKLQVLYGEPQVDRIKQDVAGIGKIEYRGQVSADLMAPAVAMPDSLGGVIDHLASLSGGDLDVKLEVRLKRHGDYATSSQNLLKSLLRGLGGTLASSRRLRVETLPHPERGQTAKEVLELVQYRMAAKVVLPQHEVGTKDLEAFVLDELASVCGDWDTLVREAVRPRE